MPYIGDCRGATWNTQALLARDPGSQNAKSKLAAKLHNEHDFTGLQETHGTPGAAAAAKLPRDCVAFWSHGSAQLAGVSLWCKPDFLKNFNPVNSDSWQELVPGRAGRLQLRGSRGSLDIYVVYFNAGAAAGVRQERAQIMRAIAERMEPQQRVLSLILGDFNFAASMKDRWIQVGRRMVPRI